MARQSKLNWDNERAGWLSRYRGRRKRFPGGSGKSDRQAYNAARESWKLWKQQVDLEIHREALAYLPDYHECLRGWEAAKEHGLSVDDSSVVEEAQARIDELKFELERKSPADFPPTTTTPPHCLRNTTSLTGISTISGMVLGPRITPGRCISLPATSFQRRESGWMLDSQLSRIERKAIPCSTISIYSCNTSESRWT